MGSAHVVPVPLGTDPSLLGSLVPVARWQCCGGRGPVCADGRVLIHDAAERPAGAGVLRRRPEGDEGGRQVRKSGNHSGPIQIANLPPKAEG